MLFAKEENMLHELKLPTTFLIVILPSMSSCTTPVYWNYSMVKISPLITV